MINNAQCPNKCGAIVVVSRRVQASEQRTNLSAAQDTFLCIHTHTNIDGNAQHPNGSGYHFGLIVLYDFSLDVLDIPSSCFPFFDPWCEQNFSTGLQLYAWGAGEILKNFSRWAQFLQFRLKNCRIHTQIMTLDYVPGANKTTHKIILSLISPQSTQEGLNCTDSSCPTHISLVKWKKQQE